jgi:guanylate kinase
MTEAPELSTTQRQFGASVSLELRRARAAVKRSMRSQLFHPSTRLQAAFGLTVAQGMKVRTLLLALPGIGPKRADAMLAEAGIDPARTVRQMGTKQRGALLRLLRT